MDLGELMTKIKGAITEDSLYPINNIKSQEQLDIISKEYGLDLKYSTIEGLREYMGEEASNLYLNFTGWMPYCYFNKELGAYIELYDGAKVTLENINAIEKIKQNNKALKELIEQKDYETLFVIIDEPARLYMYEKLYNDIPDKDKYKVFNHVYTNSDYGFSNYDKDFIRKILSFSNYKFSKDKRLKKYINKDGYVTIYRGEGAKSTPYADALSWTTNFNTAIFFASRYRSKEMGRIYMAKVKANNIIDYITHRNENEVLIFPENVEEVDQLPMMDIKNTMEQFNMTNAYLYNIFNKEIKNRYYDKPENIHGILHTKRVLMLVLLIGTFECLSEEDINVLTYSAVYHDIGRTNENKDDFHGIQSFKKLKKIHKIPHDLSREEVSILKYIIEKHCIGDKAALEEIGEYHIKDKERAIKLLEYFKDADNLDRVRLGDLDFKYLRCNTAKKLPLFAQALLHQWE